jgi:hypothetical protein
MVERARTRAELLGCADRMRTVESDLLGWRLDAAYDLVLCHCVLPYLDQGSERRVWQLLREAVQPQGAASVISTNPVSEVLSAVHRDGDAELALRRFDGQAVYTGIFHHKIRSLQRKDAEDVAVKAGFEVTRRIGLRVAVDLLPDGPAKHDPGAIQPSSNSSSRWPSKSPISTWDEPGSSCCVDGAGYSPSGQPRTKLTSFPGTEMTRRTWAPSK